MGEQKYCLSIATANTSGKQYLIEKQSIYTGNIRPGLRSVVNVVAKGRKDLAFVPRVETR